MKVMKPLQFKLLVLFAILIFQDISVLAQDKLVMGVFPRRNSVTTIKMFEPLAKHLSNQVGIEVELQTAKNFRTFWENVSRKKYDIVHYNQLHYLLSNKSAGYVVFAKNEEFGLSQIQSALVVRKDSGIETVKDLKGKKILFGGGKLAMIAHVGVRIILEEHGLHEGDYISDFALNPPNSSLAVFFKQADAAGVGNISLFVPGVKKRVDTTQLKVLATGTPQPHLPWAMRDDLDEEVAFVIRHTFINLKNSNEGRQALSNAALTNILPADDNEYDVTRQLYKEYKKTQKPQP